MTIVDRYLFFLFLKTFLVCFLSFTGLYIVVHLFSNLDELIAVSKTMGWPTLFYEFYVPRIALLYDKTAGIMTLVAAIFSVSLLQRRREMTAIEAAGITKSRILRPIFVTAFVIIALTVANREFLIPQMKERLVQTPQTLNGGGQIDIAVQEDMLTGVELRGDQLFIGESRISEASIQLPVLEGIQVPRIQGKSATIEPATETHPRGIWMHDLAKPEIFETLVSLKAESGEIALYSPADTAWLGPKECFVACHFDVEQIAYGNSLANFRSTRELLVLLHQPQRWSHRRQQIAVHSRFLIPILDYSLLLLGLPLVIGGIERNVFVSAGVCFWIVVAVQLTTTACQFLGSANVIRPPSLAAWAPVLVFVPFAVVSMRRLNR